MAVTPHMEVPAVNNADILSGSPIKRPATGINNIPEPTAAKTTGIPEVPVDMSSKKLSFAATQTMPPCSIVFVEYVIPGLKVSVEYPTVFLRAIPSKIETGMPETGIESAELMKLAI
jgi:hypothetical protein